MVSSSRSQVETEHRFLVDSAAPLVRRIESRGFTYTQSEQITDTWFAPSWVRSLEDHEEWLASTAGRPCRLRRVRDDSSESTMLEVKSPVTKGEYVQSLETQMRVIDATEATEFLEALGFRALITTVRQRRWYEERSSDVRLALDEYTIPEPVTILEVEASGQPPAALKDAEWLVHELAEVPDSTTLYFLRASLPKRQPA